MIPGILFAVVSLQVEYRAPARLDDELRDHLRTAARRARPRCTSCSASTARHAAGAAPAELLLEAQVRVACVDARRPSSRAAAGIPARAPWRRRRLKLMGEQLSIVRLIAAGERAGADRDRASCCSPRSCPGPSSSSKRRIIARARREADRFESRFWSGRRPGAAVPRHRVARRRHRHGGHLRIRLSRIRAPAPERGGAADQLLEGSRRAMRVAQLKEIDRLEHSLATLATRGQHQPLRRPVWHRVGHHERLLIAR